jgi:hypothetical protein
MGSQCDREKHRSDKENHASADSHDQPDGGDCGCSGCGTILM